MNIDFTYVPTATERRQAILQAGFSWMLYLGMAGAVVAVFGIGSLSRAAASHGESTGPALLATLAGMLLMFLPLLNCLWILQAAFHDHGERRISITDTQIRIETEGTATEVTLDQFQSFRETSGQWILRAGATRLAIPKRAVPSERAGELEAFLRERSAPSTPADH